MAIGIREARENLPSLVKRAAYGEEDIVLGTRGAEEVTMVATRKYRRMQERLAVLEARTEGEMGTHDTAVQPVSREGKGEKPFSGLQRALEAGLLRIGRSSEPRHRRVIADYSPTSSLPREERIRIGSRGANGPEFRRKGPRA